jgi:hypothetical protein
VTEQSAARRRTAKRKTARRKAARRHTNRRQTIDERPAEPVPLLDDLFAVMPARDDNTSASTGEDSLHALFQQQTMEMLDRADLSEEQKQSILVAMNCPCCGGSGIFLPFP